MRMNNRGWSAVIAIVALMSLLAVALMGCEEDEGKVKPTEKMETRRTHRGTQRGTERGTQRGTQRGTVKPGAEPSKFDTDNVRAPAGEIIKINAASFDSEVLQSRLPVLLDFTADWCGPCRALHPILEELAADYTGRAKIVQINTDDNSDLAREYDVRGIPALFVIKGGKVVDETVGLQSKPNLKTMLDRHIN